MVRGTGFGYPTYGAFAPSRAPLGHTTRRGGPTLSIGIALAVTILFLILIRISQGLGAGGIVPPVLAAWIPNLVFLASGVVLMLKVRT